MKEQPSFNNFALYFLAGGTSGALAKIISAPLYRPMHPFRPSGINVTVVNLTYINIRRYFLNHAFSFGWKDTFRSFFPKYNPKTEFAKFSLINIVSGGLAGAFSLCLNYPLDYPRVGVFDCLEKVLKRGCFGFKDLYKGFSISLAGVIPYRAVYFGMYDSLAGINPYRKREGGLTARLLSNYFIAQITASVAAYISLPFDKVRIRLLLQVERDTRLYSGILDCFKKIIKQEGVAKLFGGSVVYSITTALVLVLYDETKILMGFRDGFSEN
jgi:solute carrier family 25 (adenine nucleotide translocator) protein 4/5/6/31